MNRFALKNRPAAQAIPNDTGFAIPQQSGAASAATQAMVQVPQFDANGQIVKDASGANVMQTVPANSQLASLVKPASWHGPAMKVLGLLVTAAVVYGAAYYGAKLAIRKARAAKHESRKSSRRGGAVVEAI